MVWGQGSARQDSDHQRLGLVVHGKQDKSSRVPHNSSDEQDVALPLACAVAGRYAVQVTMRSARGADTQPRTPVNGYFAHPFLKMKQI